MAGRDTHGVVGLDEGVVDRDDFNVAVLDGIAEDDATDATEAVDSNLGLGHDEEMWLWLWLLGERGGERESWWGSREGETYLMFRSKRGIGVAEARSED
jgi:hypothetical protein